MLYYVIHNHDFAYSIHFQQQYTQQKLLVLESRPRGHHEDPGTAVGAEIFADVITFPVHPGPEVINGCGTCDVRTAAGRTRDETSHGGPKCKSHFLCCFFC